MNGDLKIEPLTVRELLIKVSEQMGGITKELKNLGESIKTDRAEVKALDTKLDTELKSFDKKLETEAKELKKEIKELKKDLEIQIDKNTDFRNESKGFKGFLPWISGLIGVLAFLYSVYSK